MIILDLIMTILDLIKLKLGIKEKLEEMVCLECGKKINIGREAFCVTWTEGPFHETCYQSRVKNG